MIFLLASCCLFGTCIPCYFDEFSNINVSSTPLTHTQQQLMRSASIKAAEMTYEHVKKNKKAICKKSSNSRPRLNKSRNKKT